jgi:hypothetical protein
LWSTKYGWFTHQRGNLSTKINRIIKPGGNPSSLDVGFQSHFEKFTLN